MLVTLVLLRIFTFRILWRRETPSTSLWAILNVFMRLTELIIRKRGAPRFSLISKRHRRKVWAVFEAWWSASYWSLEGCSLLKLWTCVSHSSIFATSQPPKGEQMEDGRGVIFCHLPSRARDQDGILTPFVRWRGLSESSLFGETCWSLRCCVAKRIRITVLSRGWRYTSRA